MNKLVKILLFIFIFLNLNTVFWYDISYEKKQTLDKVITYLNTDLDKRDFWFYDEKLQKIEKIIPRVKSNYENWYFFSQVKFEIQDIIDENYIVIIPEDEKVSHDKKYLHEKYYNWLANKNLEEKCLKYFDFIDEIARKNDFPTSLVIATWRVESSCNLKNPDNWDGPFQILSHYYEPGDITLEEFWIAVENFINFSKHKWRTFEKNKSAKFHFWKDKIEITYDNFSELDLRIHSALYNWLRSSKMYDATYINWNLTQKLNRKKDGILTIMVKVIDYQIKK